MPCSPIRVLIIDDHPLVRQSLAELLGHQQDFFVCGITEDTASAMSIIDESKPEIVVLDLQLKNSHGIEGVKLLKESFPNTKIVVFSGHDECLYAPRVIRVGASGYVCKAESAEKLLAALRKVAEGKIHLSEEMENQLLKELANGKAPLKSSPVDCLTHREFQIFTLYGQGIGTSAIAEQLNISVKTVEAHRGNIKDKLNLKSASEFLHRAIEWMQNRNTTL